MKHDDKETLSQLMDGEWQDLNAAQSVEAACADDELKSKWARYHLIRDVIRNDEIRVDASLTSRISQAIEDEPTYSNVSAINTRVDTKSTEVKTLSATESVTELNSRQRKSTHWRAGFGGAAVAASVALATVVGLNVWQVTPESGNNIQTIAGAAPVNVPGVVLPQVELVANKGSYWVTPTAERNATAEKRLNMMLSAHIERSPTAERSGMLPYSRLVGYDSVTSEQ